MFSVPPLQENPILCLQEESLVNRFRPYRRRQEGAADVKARRRRKPRRPTPPHREEEPSEGATLRDPPFPRGV
jgi:hypothetical protein